MKRIEPLITEKSIDLAKKGKYTLSVSRELNKHQISQIVNDLYGFEVTNINVINQEPRKVSKMRGQIHKKGNKKAIISIKEDKIFPGFEMAEEDKKSEKKKKKSDK